MPNFFLNGTFGQVPNFMGVELHDKETFEQWYTSHHVGPIKVRDMTKVNNHRYRQTRFISQCAHHLVESHPSEKVLLSLLDTDEYLVVNPMIIKKKRYRERSNITFAKESGWIDQWLENFVNSVGLQTATVLLEPYILPNQ